MSVGLTNTLTAFMELITRVFCEYVDSFVVVFIDDIRIYCMSREEYEHNFRMTLKVLKVHELYAKFSKCEF